MQIFSHARLKLTIWYVLVITFVSLCFSFVIYRMQVMEIVRIESTQRARIEARIENGMGIYPIGTRHGFILVDDELIQEAKERLLYVLGIFNSGVILISAALGYFLAGKTLNPIEKMVREQSRFIGDASHELRTPLTALMTSIEVYQRDQKSTKLEANELINQSLEQVKKLQKLSNSLLALSSPTASYNDFKKISLDTLISESIKVVHPMADKKSVKINSQLSPLMIKGSEEHLRELFTIILDNAVKYVAPKKGIVKIVATKNKNNALITIKDNGVGISQSDLPHIFDRFFRADTSRSSSGNGLGLSIAQRIARSHKGQITCQSKLGVGTTFIVTLPIQSHLS